MSRFGWSFSSSSFYSHLSSAANARKQKTANVAAMSGKISNSTDPSLK
jgi:hypothetical protein